MLRWIALISVFVAICGVASAEDKPHAATCPGNATASGYFAGTAVSQQAGKLNVTLNLICEGGRYVGSFVTPVGKFDVTSGQLQGTTFVLDFSAGTDSGKLYADRVGDKLQGRFVFGDDSGPVEMVRISDAEPAGYDVPTLNLTPTQWREDLHYFAAGGSEGTRERLLSFVARSVQCSHYRGGSRTREREWRCGIRDPGYDRKRDRRRSHVHHVA
jgi:hypothetical protein